MAQPRTQAQGGEAINGYIWSHTCMLANIVHSFEYGQLSTHKNVGVQEMTSVAPRHLSQSCAQRTATLYSYCSYFTQYPLSDSKVQLSRLWVVMCYHLCIIIALLSSSLLCQYNGIYHDDHLGSILHIGQYFFLTFFFNSCVTVYGLPFLADNSESVAVLSLSKSYVVNSCLP